MLAATEESLLSDRGLAAPGDLLDKEHRREIMELRFLPAPMVCAINEPPTETQSPLCSHEGRPPMRERALQRLRPRGRVTGSDDLSPSRIGSPADLQQISGELALTRSGAVICSLRSLQLTLTPTPND